jgi:hypothetical protein
MTDYAPSYYTASVRTRTYPRVDEDKLRAMWVAKDIPGCVLLLDPVIEGLTKKLNKAAWIYASEDKAQNVRVLLLTQLPKYTHIDSEHMLALTVKIIQNEVQHRIPSMLRYSDPIEWSEADLLHREEDRIHARLSIESLLSRVDPTTLPKSQNRLLKALRASMTQGEFTYENTTKLCADFGVDKSVWLKLLDSIRLQSGIEAAGLNDDRALDIYSDEQIWDVLDMYYRRGIVLSRIALRYSCPVAYISSIVRGYIRPEIKAKYTQANPGLVTKNHSPYGQRMKLTPDQVRYCYTSPLSDQKLAIELGLRYPTVSAIRKGKIHREIYAEYHGLPIPKRKGRKKKAYGERDKRPVKLHQKDIPTMFERYYLLGDTARAIASDYSLSYTTIATVLRGEIHPSVYDEYQTKFGDLKALRKRTLKEATNATNIQ